MASPRRWRGSGDTEDKQRRGETAVRVRRVDHHGGGAGGAPFNELRAVRAGGAGQAAQVEQHDGSRKGWCVMVRVGLDDRFTRPPKVLRAGPPAAWLPVCGLAYCARYKTNGHIPAEAVPGLSNLPNAYELAHQLVDACTRFGEHGLWEVVEGGCRVHDDLDWNPSKDAVRAGSERHAEGMPILPAELERER